jgi:uncharacterized membrane protein YkvA (DUF1232 family)
VGTLLLNTRREVQKVFSWPFRGNRTVIIFQETSIGMNWKNQAQRVHREARVYYFAFKHARVPWYAKLVAACSAGYLFSPIQLIPSYIPLIGFLDDFFVLFVGAKLLQKLIPPEVLSECRQLANTAEMRREQEVRSAAAVIAFIAIATVWLLAAVGASMLMLHYISPGRAVAN